MPRRPDVGSDMPAAAPTGGRGNARGSIGVPGSPADGDELVRLDGGTFLMGDDGPDVNPGDGEGPVREVTLRAFGLAPTAVTVRQFAAFVADAAYTTDAEREGWSFVFAGFLAASDRSRVRGHVTQAPWWLGVDGASWWSPEGPSCHVEDRQDHPVTHVSHADALAYCAWAGRRLPTEAEWEYAARGGRKRARYPWGDELTPGGRHLCNIWQGEFPRANTAEDGYIGTAPVGSYPANEVGLFDMAGNVWEWCRDRFDRTHPPGPLVDPTGPETGTARVIRGGSYLCHASYCNRYRVSARSQADPMSTTGNTGFRVAAPTVRRPATSK